MQKKGEKALMGLYRKINTSFWNDSDMQELTPEEKYFYLYLMTNDYTNLLGIYEISLKNISYETGYNQDTVTKLLDKFISYGKIYYSYENKEIMLINWFKYNNSSSPKTKTAIKEQLEKVKTFEFVEKYISICNQKTQYLDRSYIHYIYSISSNSISNSISNSNIKTYVCDFPENQQSNFDKDVPAENLSESELRGADSDHSLKSENRKDRNLEEFEKIWEVYPRKVEKTKAYKAFLARLKQKHKSEVMLKAAINYAQHCELDKIEERYIKHLSTFLGPNVPFLDFINYSPKPKKGRLSKINNDNIPYNLDDLEEKMFKKQIEELNHEPPN